MNPTVSIIRLARHSERLFVNPPRTFPPKLAISAVSALVSICNLQAQSVLVKDIHDGPAGKLINFTPLHPFGADSLLALEDSVHGTELYKQIAADGTLVLVKDIRPGLDSSSPASFVTIGPRVLFTANTPDSVLHTTDGTAAGTVSLIPAGKSGTVTAATPLVPGAGYVIFNGAVGTEALALWRSDGTPAGTYTLPSLMAGSTKKALAVGGTIYFASAGATGKSELWKTNGTVAGTSLIKDINPNGSGSPTFFFALGQTTYFSATAVGSGMELWKTDGTLAGTVIVKDIRGGTASSNPDSAGVLGANGYFLANDGISGTELWTTDGTATGTVRLTDIRPGSGDATQYYGLYPFSGGLAFIANDGVHGTELWKTDGTTSGTVMVKDIRPGPQESLPSNIGSVNGLLYFTAIDGVNGWELWKSDGTEAGTVLVRDIAPGPTSSNPSQFRSFQGKAVFQANDGVTGIQWWQSDGSALGTARFTALDQGTAASSPDQGIGWNGRVWFAATDATAGRELWSSDGTTAGTSRLIDLVPGPTGSAPTPLGVVGSALCFSATTADAGTELWKTDGTAVGTILLGDLISGTPSSAPVLVYNDGQILFFTAFGAGTGRELWRTDGTPTGTWMVQDLVTGSASSTVIQMTKLGREYLVATGTSAFDGKLWFTDGSRWGTRQLANGLLPYLFLSSGNFALFSASTSTNEPALWRTDGTSAGTIPIKDFSPAVNHWGLESLFAWNGRSFASAADSNGLYQIWETNGTDAGTIPMTNLPSPNGKLGNIVSARNGIFFTTSSPGNGTELWKSSGTPAGTSMVADLTPGSTSTTFLWQRKVGDGVFLSIRKPETGAELWASNGTSAGTRIVEDLAAGTGESNPTAVAIAAGKFLYAATTVTTDRELRSVAVSGASLSFGTVDGFDAPPYGWTRTLPWCRPGQTSEASFRVSNLGDSPATGLSLVLPPSPPGEFEFVGVMPETLAAGESVVITARFTSPSILNRRIPVTLRRDDFTEGVFHIDGQSLGPEEWWRTRFYGTILNLGKAADESDPDGDGLSNLAERALGNSPLTSDQPELAILYNGGSRTVSYRRANPLGSGCLCQLEWSDTMKSGTWTSEGISESLASEAQGIQTIHATLPPSNNSALFARVRMTKP